MKGQWGKLVGYFLATLLVSAAVTFGLPLLGGGSWLPELVSDEGSSIDMLFWGLMWLSLVIFSIVGAVVIYSITHFRAEPGDMSDGAHIHGNAKMELAWVVVPSIIVFVIGILSYDVMRQNEVGLFDKAAASDKGAATMAVDVRGFSFGWAFHYTDLDGAPLAAKGAPTSSNLVLPVNEVVRFNVMSCSGKEKLGRVREQVRRELASHGHAELIEIDPGLCERHWDLTTEEDVAAAEDEAKELFRVRGKRADGHDLSTQEQELLDAQPRFHGDNQFVDVNHAFWVPEARLKVDAVSGLRTYVQWKPTRVTGPQDTYQVVCAELCGSGHNGMRTDMCVVDRSTFDWFVALDEKTQPVASCINLRLFSCDVPVDDLDALLEDVAALTKKNATATCADAEEALA